MNDREHLRQRVKRGDSHWGIEVPFEAMPPDKAGLVVQRERTTWAGFDSDRA